MLISLHVLALAALQSCSPTFKAPITNFQVIPYAEQIAVADLDFDGFLDVVAVGSNGVTAGVEVRHGLANDCFGAAAFTSSPESPEGVAIGDFDGVGPLDIAIAHGGGASSTFGYRVLLGQADGSYVAMPSNALSLSPNSIAAADFDRDGKLDVVLAVGSNSLRVAYGNGSGAFSSSMTVTIGGSSRNVRARDVDGDGWPDLVANTGSGATTRLAVRRGIDGHNFAAVQTQSTADDASELSLADFDRDGRLDALTVPGSGFGTQDAWVHLGQADGSFAPALRYPVGSAALGSCVGDFDGDGWVDIGVSALSSGVFGPQVFLLLRNLGAGVFSTEPHLSSVGSTATQRAADFDRDGKDDLLRFGLSSGRMYVLTSGPAGTPSLGQELDTTSPGADVKGLASADFDHDGRAELMVGGYTGTRLYERRPLDQFALVQHLAVANTEFEQQWAIGDLDGDGREDLAGATLSSSSNVGPTRLHVGLADGTFATQPTSPVLAGATKVAIADVDGDGANDLVLYSLTAQSLRWHRNLGQLQFAAGAPITGVVGSPSLADFDHDGLPDLLVETSPGQLQVARNTGGGVFARPISSLGAGRSPAIGDLNGDGSLDVAATSGSLVRLWYGRGNATFERGPDLDFGIPNGSVMWASVADVDADGASDLVATGNNELLLARGQGGGHFLAPEHYWIGNAFGAPLCADIDHDGKLDVAVFPSSFGGGAVVRIVYQH